MTENQRNYLADLAGEKGVTLSGTDDISVSRASEMIEELKAMPDASFDPVSDEESEEISKLTTNVLVELRKWNFQR